MNNERIKIPDDKLKELLKLHEKWVDRDSGGVRLDLKNVDLSNKCFRGITLYRANLENADLSNASIINSDLSYANLSNANLYMADLNHSDLTCANLNNADLSLTNLKDSFLNGASLRDANLSNADLRNASLKHTNLLNANLSNACCSYCTLSYTNLSGCNLKMTNFENSNLTGAILDESEKFRYGVILDKKIIGYKKCKYGRIVTLEIPKGAIVFTINGYKFRTNKAKCIAISNGATIAYSNFENLSFTYEIGKTYSIKDFNLIYNIECASGIHFFKSREDAENY